MRVAAHGGGGTIFLEATRLMAVLTKDCFPYVEVRFDYETRKDRDDFMKGFPGRNVLFSARCYECKAAVGSCAGVMCKEVWIPRPIANTTIDVYE